ncbi:MAG: multiple sugar transport system substrate-binding protein [Actinomycetota bacterium]|nr:multiple sugar transport system substrate-binding protein [Actinomycetota bacterium]MDQ1641657.1 multiple sugar transport system substrate-binding protein [Actinomycetota bacterium]
MRSSRTGVAALLVAVTATSLLTACGSSTKKDTGTSANGKVTISVEGWRPGSEQATIDTFKAQVAAFEALHKNIHVDPREWEWKGETFATQLAGGTLPTSFRVPFTDGKGLIERNQIADLTDAVKALPYASKFNPTVLAAAQGPDGHIYGLPTGVYGIGLHYNRSLFTKAGLDPNKPPATWDELRADAKAIADKTGAAGFAVMSKGNTGGWNLTTLTYALGGRMESVSGTTVSASVDNAGTKEALDRIKAMRWVDHSMGSAALLDWSGINQQFAAGKIGMYMSGSDVYSALVQQNSIKPADYGLALLPMSDSPDAGLLGGGSVVAVSAKASKAQQNAAVLWNDYYYMRKLVQQDAAALDAKTLQEGKQPVGTPQLPIFDAATLTQYNDWIKPYVNVPLDQMSSFTSGVFSQKLVAEPPAHTQELYALLDSVVQKVLSDKNADINSVLSKVNGQAQSLVSAG